MSLNKLCIILVLSSFVIGGGLVASAAILYNDNSSSISTSKADKSSNGSLADKKENESEPTDASSEMGDVESSESDTSSEETVREKESIEVPRDENGFELPYDVMPIVNAYFSGDDTALNDKQYETLLAAKDVLDSIIADNMTEYEKVKAVHDYIVQNNEYYEESLNALGHSTLDEASPYGVLINHKSVCKGYATAFKLLCNMCGLDCELITEYDDKTTDINHLYNRVKLEGSWYYADVTWDDGDFDDYDYKYLCVTREQFAYNHKLGDDCPESDSFKNTYAAQNIIDVNSIDEFRAEIKRLKYEHTPTPYYFRFGKDMGIKLIYRPECIGYDYSFNEDNITELVDIVVDETSISYYDYSKTMIDGEVILRISK